MKMYIIPLRSRISAVGLALGLALAVLTSAPSTFAVRTYYADEGLTYNGHGCQNVNLSSDISFMLSSMDSDGFSGSYYTDANAWPQDFREACSSQYGSGGLDSTYADAKRVSIFSGHGGPGVVSFSYIRNGVCDHYLGGNGRLGSMAGSQSAVGIYSSCDTLSFDSLVGGANWQWEHENLGFYGLVSNGLWPLYNYFYGTSDRGNAAAWLDAFDGGYVYPTNWPSYPAIAVAYGSDASDCWYYYDNTSLKNDWYLAPRYGGPSCGQGQPGFIYCWGNN